jgi:8-oxo-dGTP pyrophosphatase MutT (NUDIX family)
MKRYLISPLPRRALHAWFRLRRSLTLGVRGLVRDRQGRVLLIRHTYSRGWHFPGGGVERREAAEEALARELVEEAGIEIAGKPHLFGIYSNEDQFAGDHIILYLIDSFQQRDWRPTREIAEARFFDPSDLPHETTAGTQRRIAEVIAGRERSLLW